MADAKVEAVSAWNKYKNMIPTTSKCFAIILLILNVIWPGLGTAIMGCISPEFLTENLIIALLQFILFFCLIGWIWSIIWGVFCLLKSRD